MRTETKTVTIYESFVRAAESLSDSQRGKFYHAIMRYSLYGEEPELDERISVLFELVRPVLDKSKVRKMAGKRGGESASKVQAKYKQNSSKTEANEKQSASDVEVEEEVEYKENITKEKNTKSKAKSILPDNLQKPFDDWLLVWSENHNSGKDMPELQMQAQIETIMRLPETDRLPAIQAAIRGGWKNIHDIRQGKDQEQKGGHGYAPEF